MRKLRKNRLKHSGIYLLLCQIRIVTSVNFLKLTSSLRINHPRRPSMHKNLLRRIIPCDVSFGFSDVAPIISTANQIPNENPHNNLHCPCVCWDFAVKRQQHSNRTRTKHDKWHISLGLCLLSLWALSWTLAEGVKCIVCSCNVCTHMHTSARVKSFYAKFWTTTGACWLSEESVGGVGWLPVVC